MSQEYGVPIEEIEVENIVLKPGSKKGDGFSSDIAAVEFQAIFNGKTLDKYYIAKYAPDGNRGEVLKMVQYNLWFFATLVATLHKKFHRYWKYIILEF